MVAVNTRIAERLNKLYDSSTEDRSKDLAALTKKFEDFSKQFQPFSDALKAHYDAMKALEETHAKVMDHILDRIKNTPLEDGPENIIAVQQELMKKNQTYSQRYLQYVVVYVQEWENIVRARVEKWAKQVKDEKKELDHYEKKVSSLKKARSPDADKLQRNEEKLEIVRNEYIVHVNYLCNLITEAVDCSWIDLHPLLFRIINLDNDRLGDEAAVVICSGVIDKLVAIAATYEIDVTLPEEPETPPKNDSDNNNHDNKAVKPASSKNVTKASEPPKDEEAPKPKPEKMTQAPEPPKHEDTRINTKNGPSATAPPKNSSNVDDEEHALMPVSLTEEKPIGMVMTGESF